jgi:acyl-CoA synthetase (NDP forming)
VRALFAQAGVIECHGAEDLAETALLLGQQPLPAGPRVAILSNAGGMGVLAADLADECGLTVPELSTRLRKVLAGHVLGTCGTGNPVDAGAGAAPVEVAALAEALLRSDEVDALVVLLVATGVSDSLASMQRLREVRETGPDKPVLLVTLGGLRADEVDLGRITTYRTAEAALRALGRAARYRVWRDQPHEPEEPDDPEVGDRARELARGLLADCADGGWLDAGQARELLAGHGLAPIGELVHGAAEAAETADRLGFPVAVKVAAGEVVHRTERGLVRVGLRTRDEVAEAVAGFERELGTSVPVLVQPVVSGVEVALGIVRDPGFGPLVMVAAGGVATELWHDRVFLVPPVSRREAARAVRALRIWPLLHGYRGGPVADVASLEEALVRVGRFADDVPHVAELDVNPVLVGTDGCRLVDVKVRLGPCPALDAGIPRRLRRPV